jgi:hypothetical protein
METSENSDINPTANDSGKPEGSERDEKGRFPPDVLQPGARPFKPGESGNPKGGSAKQRMTSALIQAMNKKEGIDEALANVALSKALKGDIRFMELLFDRIDGKVLEKSEINFIGTVPALKPEEAMAAIEEAYRKRHASNKKGREKKHHDQAR